MENTQMQSLRILKGLRVKFAREMRTNIKYTPLELHMMLSEALRKIENNQIVIIKQPNPIWDKIDEQVERSKIKRYPWKKILGKSLTQEILIYKRFGRTVEETFQEIANDPKVQEFIFDNPKEEKKLIKNLEISVHARYGENNTSNKVMGIKQ